MNPQLMYSLPGEHAAKSGFSFRQGLSIVALGYLRFCWLDPKIMADFMHCIRIKIVQ